MNSVFNAAAATCIRCKNGLMVEKGNGDVIKMGEEHGCQHAESSSISVLATGFDQYESSSISLLATDRSNGALYRLVAPGGGWNEGRALLSPLSPLSAPKYDLNAGGIVIKLAKGATCRLQEGRP